MQLNTKLIKNHHLRRTNHWVNNNRLCLNMNRFVNVIVSHSYSCISHYNTKLSSDRPRFSQQELQDSKVYTPPGQRITRLILTSQHVLRSGLHIGETRQIRKEMRKKETSPPPKMQKKEPSLPPSNQPAQKKKQQPPRKKRQQRKKQQQLFTDDDDDFSRMIPRI